ncbi:MAG: TIGR04282 family arsenosugar biosynthesis glycosyltransferase [Deltaproteobacteria bacterium]|nr:TIGR04282 family arsenosugar biosynthesis glycosyltransferase [Deltaproteobacteria bacterium]
MTFAPIAVFLRPPRPGTTKTRLTPSLGSIGAAALYEAFVEDVVARCRGAPGLEPELWVAGDLDDPFIRGLCPELRRTRQPDLDLGGRMAAALEAAVRARGRGLVIGTDVPTLPAAHLVAARDALESADLVLGPSADGGYYLVGVRDNVPDVFRGVRYSTRHCLADTLKRARTAGVTVALLPPWYDVDTPQDLRLLRLHVALDPSRARATAARLAEM